MVREQGAARPAGRLRVGAPAHEAAVPDEDVALFGVDLADFAAAGAARGLDGGRAWLGMAVGEARGRASSVSGRILTSVGWAP